ncbi:MAG: hypothetical protein QM296_09360 [Bacillota bacterium]|nr:hypothetical protein [Bacillota bacterium]
MGVLFPESDKLFEMIRRRNKAGLRVEPYLTTVWNPDGKLVFALKEGAPPELQTSLDELTEVGRWLREYSRKYDIMIPRVY